MLINVVAYDTRPQQDKTQKYGAATGGTSDYNIITGMFDGNRNAEIALVGTHNVYIKSDYLLMNFGTFDCTRIKVDQKGVNVPVSQGATAITITLPIAEPDVIYGVLVIPNWSTSVYIVTKTTTSFTVGFGTSAPSNAKIDWLLYR